MLLATAQLAQQVSHHVFHTEVGSGCNLYLGQHTSSGWLPTCSLSFCGNGEGNAEAQTVWEEGEAPFPGTGNSSLFPIGDFKCLEFTIK